MFSVCQRYPQRSPFEIKSSRSGSPVVNLRHVLAIMLVLTRKCQEVIVVGGADGFDVLLKVTVLGIENGKVRLGFEAADDVPAVTAAAPGADSAARRRRARPGAVTAAAPLPTPAARRPAQ
jgi:Global regulator protein family